jgi:phosphatidylglycerophosphate synthase
LDGDRGRRAVVARELIINALRSYLESRGVVFGADWLGKIKMVLQCATLFGVFVVLAMSARGAGPDAVKFFEYVRDGLIYAMIAATALSGLQYVWRAAWLFKAD